MRRLKIVLVAILMVPLAGCLLSGKPKAVAAPPPVPQPAATPAAPPEPLSIPQTHVDLPAPQPVNPQALDTVEPVAPPPAPAAKPTPPAPKPSRPASPVKPAEVTPQPTAPEPEQPVREPIQEILSPEEQRQYKERAHKFQADTNAVLKAVRPHTSNQRRQEQEIANFLKQSEQAETANDLRLAVQLAERAYTLAKELLSGK